MLDLPSTFAYTEDMKFSERLRAAMDGMSQAELARRSGLHQTDVSRYLLGKSQPTLGKFEALGAVLPSLHNYSSGIAPQEFRHAA